MEKISGIYKIINQTNDKYYVGSSTNISHRWHEHKRILRRNCHDNPHLQNAWNRYEEPNFIFSVIEGVSISNLLNVEQKYLDIAKSESDKCYNISFVSDNPMFGRHHSVGTKLKMQELKIGKRHTQEHNQKIAKSLLGNTRNYEKIHSIEQNMRSLPLNWISTSLKVFNRVRLLGASQVAPTIKRAGLAACPTQVHSIGGVEESFLSVNT
jgi:group I intron endonuclease